jgi:DNA replication protein DnaC
LLFEVVAARYEVGSIVITTNRPFRGWGKILDVDNTLATALIDWLMHHGDERTVISHISPRMRDRLARPWDRRYAGFLLRRNGHGTTILAPRHAGV